MADYFDDFDDDAFDFGNHYPEAPFGTASLTDYNDDQADFEEGDFDGSDYRDLEDNLTLLDSIGHGREGNYYEPSVDYYMPGEDYREGYHNEGSQNLVNHSESNQREGIRNDGYNNAAHHIEIYREDPHGYHNEASHNGSQRNQIEGDNSEADQTDGDDSELNHSESNYDDHEDDEEEVEEEGAEGDGGEEYDSSELDWPLSPGRSFSSSPSTGRESGSPGSFTSSGGSSSDSDVSRLRYDPRFDAINAELRTLRETRERLEEQVRHLRARRQEQFGPSLLGSGLRPLPFPNRNHLSLDMDPQRRFRDSVDGLFGTPEPGLPVHQEQLDDLVEMEFERVRESRRRTPGAQSQIPVRQSAVIDLTGESDGFLNQQRQQRQMILTLPGDPQFSQASASGQQNYQNQQNRNPRRQTSHIRRTPSLARSDGSLLGSGPRQVIDLTVDSSPEILEVRSIPANPNRQQQHHQQQGQPAGQPRTGGGENMNAPHISNRSHGFLRNFPAIGIIHRIHHFAYGHVPEVEIQMLGENPGNGFNLNMNNPLADNPVNFNYGAGGFNRDAQNQKPVHVAPPPPREGFTRATGNDAAVICPSCEEELKYDPNEDEAKPPPAKKARNSRKDREEHHFWAIKACGHVFCKTCYENRKPNAKNPIKTGFRPAEKKILCAVEDCTSDVSSKAAWVGIFL